MFEKNPLLYIAIKYLFFTKDKIVFFMQQFSLLVISLSIATIFAAFSVMNGFEDQIKTKILKHTAPIVVTQKIKDKDDYFNSISEYNNGFIYETIDNKDILKIESIRNNYSFMVIETSNKAESFKVNIQENPKQEKTISINNLLFKKLKTLNSDEITVLHPDSYEKNTGKFTKSKTYSNLLQKDIVNDDSSMFEVYLSTKEYLKFIGNTNTNKLNIYPKEDSKTEQIYKFLSSILNSKLEVKTWMDAQPQLINALQLQRKIFWLLYLVMFILLSAVIISTNIAFFKEKRKDWALLSILNIIPNSVVKIFVYKNLLTFSITSFLGLILGGLISIYSNELISFMFSFAGMKASKEYFFGINKISYIFSIQDALMIVSFSFIIFFINFAILTSVFKKENISNIIKGH